MFDFLFFTISNYFILWGNLFCHLFHGLSKPCHDIFLALFFAHIHPVVALFFIFTILILNCFLYEAISLVVNILRPMLERLLWYFCCNFSCESRVVVNRSKHNIFYEKRERCLCDGIANSYSFDVIIRTFLGHMLYFRGTPVSLFSLNFFLNILMLLFYKILFWLDYFQSLIFFRLRIDPGWDGGLLGLRLCLSQGLRMTFL